MEPEDRTPVLKGFNDGLKSAYDGGLGPCGCILLAVMVSGPVLLALLAWSGTLAYWAYFALALPSYLTITVLIHGARNYVITGNRTHLLGHLGLFFGLMALWVGIGVVAFGICRWDMTAVWWRWLIGHVK